jgi:5-methylthioribose kinase
MIVSSAVSDTALPPEMQAFLRELGIHDMLAARPLMGGVSSDIWLVETPRERLCIKRALPALRVAAEWQAPIERSLYEYAWMQRVQAILADAVPPLRGRSACGAMFAMAYLEPRDYPLWKDVLLQGGVDPNFAGQVGTALAKIHSATAKDASIAADFDSDHIFHAIRLEPYLLATARRHADLARELRALAERTAATKRTLVHGDVSPKNILIGPAGAVFLDAECAWHGDPAFDVAFCLNHLLLKCFPLPHRADALLQAFSEFAAHYMRHVDWEDAAEMERRCATLLPALTLARIDGKSPVEYITAESDKNRIRNIARDLIIGPRIRLAEIAGTWRTRIASR